MKRVFLLICQNSYNHQIFFTKTKKKSYFDFLYKTHKDISVIKRNNIIAILSTIIKPNRTVYAK